MKDFINKFKIPTLLGLGIIVFGIIAGVILVVREQGFISQASPDVKAQDLTITNISDSSVTISWQTTIPVASFIRLGQTNPDEQTLLDDRDTKSPTNRLTHYVTAKNLLPKTAYQYKIVSGKAASEVSKFATTGPLLPQTELTPIIGSVLDSDKPLEEGMAYLSIADAVVQSSLVKNSGNFLIPLSQVVKADLSDNVPLTQDTVAKLTIISPKGQSNVLFKLADSNQRLLNIKLGEDLDLTPTPSPSPSDQDINKFDLNSDGKINAADNAIILQNFGKNPKNKKADLNKDGTVDQKDLDLMAERIKGSGSQ